MSHKLEVKFDDNKTITASIVHGTHRYESNIFKFNSINNKQELTPPEQNA